MSISLNVIGVRDDSDQHYKQMVQLKRALDAARVPYPKEVRDYFDSSDEEEPLYVPISRTEWRDDYRAGYIINIADIPQGVKQLRVYLS